MKATHFHSTFHSAMFSSLSNLILICFLQGSLHFPLTHFHQQFQNKIHQNSLKIWYENMIKDRFSSFVAHFIKFSLSALQNYCISSFVEIFLNFLIRGYSNLKTVILFQNLQQNNRENIFFIKFNLHFSSEFVLYICYSVSLLFQFFLTLFQLYLQIFHLAL